MTYEYECEACGHRWESEQRIVEEPLRFCPECGKENARRLISGAAFSLKGERWSRDGYGG